MKEHKAETAAIEREKQEYKMNTAKRGTTKLKQRVERLERAFVAYLSLSVLEYSTLSQKEVNDVKRMFAQDLQGIKEDL